MGQAPTIAAGVKRKAQVSVRRQKVVKTFSLFPILHCS